MSSAAIRRTDTLCHDIAFENVFENIIVSNNQLQPIEIDRAWILVDSRVCLSAGLVRSYGEWEDGGDKMKDCNDLRYCCEHALGAGGRWFESSHPD